MPLLDISISNVFNPHHKWVFRDLGKLEELHRLLEKCLGVCALQFNDQSLQEEACDVSADGMKVLQRESPLNPLDESKCSVRPLSHIPSQVPSLMKMWKCESSGGEMVKVLRRGRPRGAHTQLFFFACECHSRLFVRAAHSGVLTMTARGTESLQPRSCWSSILHHSESTVRGHKPAHTVQTLSQEVVLKV